MRGYAPAIARYESEMTVMRSIGLSAEQERSVFGGTLSEVTGR
jgi:hypothetical protein